MRTITLVIVLIAVLVVGCLLLYFTVGQMGGISPPDSDLPID